LLIHAADSGAAAQKGQHDQSHGPGCHLKQLLHLFNLSFRMGRDQTSLNTSGRYSPGIGFSPEGSEKGSPFSHLDRMRAGGTLILFGFIWARSAARMILTFNSYCGMQPAIKAGLLYGGLLAGKNHHRANFRNAPISMNSFNQRSHFAGRV